MSEDVSIPVDGIELGGFLDLPQGSAGCVVFVQGSGRFSSRNRQVARALADAGLGTLLFDLLGADEQAFDQRTARLRFDIGLLSGRLDMALRWLARETRSRATRSRFRASSPPRPRKRFSSARSFERVRRARSTRMA